MALATVQHDIAPLYERPTLESPRLDEVLYGMSIQIIQESETGWCYLRTEYGVEGYAPLSCFERRPEVAAAWRKYKKATVLAPYIDVQSAPLASSQRLVSIPRGGILVVLAAPGEDGWQKVGLSGGTVGYTRASYLGDVITDFRQLAPQDLRWNIVETALSYNGAAFRAGGRTPLGIDAAGLAAMSYLINGVTIPREIFLKPGGLLHTIPSDQIDEGDLIFFPTSVGLYVGDHRYVHATESPGSEGVVVNSLRAKDDDYRGDLAGQIVSIASIF